MTKSLKNALAGIETNIVECCQCHGRSNTCIYDPAAAVKYCGWSEICWSKTNVQWTETQDRRRATRLWRLCWWYGWIYMHIFYNPIQMDTRKRGIHANTTTTNTSNNNTSRFQHNVTSSLLPTNSSLTEIRSRVLCESVCVVGMHSVVINMCILWYCWWLRWAVESQVSVLPSPKSVQ